MSIFSIPRWAKLFFFLLVLILVAGGIWIWFMKSHIPTDILKESISFEDAQKLISFPICRPTYMPKVVDVTPEYIYEADAAQVREETYIRMRFNYLDSRKTALEVYERYSNTTTLQLSYQNQESINRNAAINMIWWVSLPDHLSESETMDAVNQTMLEATPFQEQQNIWWLYKIFNPKKYRSNMTHWVSHHVEYRLHSYLSVDEIKKITSSMLNCPSY